MGKYKNLHYLCSVKLKELQIMLKEITEQENDLIEAIRNYKKSFHNKSKELRRYAKILFDEMIYG